MKKKIRLQKVAIVLMFVSSMFFFSCINLKNIRLVQEKTHTDLSDEIVNENRAAYKINNGDHLYIKIYSTDPTTSKLFQADFPEIMTTSYVYLNSYKVDADGYIGFSFVERIPVKGLTIEEAQDKIQFELAQYFKDINVYVKLVNFSITVLGETGNGTFEFDKEEVTIFQAIGKAGGIGQFGNVKKVKLIRKSPNGSKVVYLDLTDNAILSSEYYFLMPNDIIYIEPRDAKNFAFSKFPYFVIGTVLGLYISATNIF